MLVSLPNRRLSPNKLIGCWEAKRRSLINKGKNVGDKTETWGRPALIVLGADL